MQVDKHIRKSVVFLQYLHKDSGETRLAGTAFLVTYPAQGLGDRTAAVPPKFASLEAKRAFRPGYLVTAGHVIRGIHEFSHNRKVIIRANNLGWKGMTSQEVPTSEWESLFPVDGPLDPDLVAKDVAVLRFSGGIQNMVQKSDLDLFDVPMEAGAFRDRRTETRMGVADDVLIVGLFSQHRGEEQNIPIVRTGTMAAMSEELIRTEVGVMDGYLIEAHSLGGLSGSPAFFHLHGFRQMSSHGIKEYPQPELYLLGLIGGHWDLTPDWTDREKWEKTHSGMSIVVPVETIVEALEMPSVKEQRDREKAGLKQG